MIAHKPRLLLLLSFFCNVLYASHLDLWENTIQLGGSKTTGNSPTTTISGKISSELDIDYPHHPWGYTLALEGKRATARGVENARFVKADAEGRYLFSKKTYAYAKINYTYDAFATYDIVVRDSIGLGRILVKDDIQKLTVELGPGGTHQRIAGAKLWQNQLIGHLEANYLRHLSDTAEYTQSFSADSGQFNTHYHAMSAIKTTVIKQLALQFSFELDSDTKIPPNSSNTQKTDTSTNITLIYTM